MIITLTPDIENALSEEARKQGITAEILALNCLRERFLASGGTGSMAKKKGTLADFLAGYIGILSSSEYVPGGAQMSQNTGKKFAKGLVSKRTQRQP